MEEKYPLLKTRIQSTLIDSVVIIIMLAIVASIIDYFPETTETVRMLLFVLVFVLYEPICITLGCTLVNYISQIRVRSAEDTSKRINLFQAIFRYPIKAVLGIISFFTINVNPRKRAIHDMLTRSVVIEL
jgi:uncharacterized RDD family membrane protein YckC